MLKKLIIIFTLSAMLAASGCAAKKETPEPLVPQPEAGISASVPEVPENEPTENDVLTEEDETMSDPLHGLVEDEYEGLELTAAVLPRMAILPGSVFPVTVSVANNGDKMIFYTLGSGVYEIPEALILQIDGLQPVIPKKHLGPVTLDFVTKELNPGDKLRFDINVMAIEPTAQFDTYTFEMYRSDNSYIAETGWPDLQKLYPDLIAAKPGSYSGKVSFRYAVPDENGQTNPFGSPTGYARTDLQITVNE